MSFDYATYSETIEICKELKESIDRIYAHKDLGELSKHVAEMHRLSFVISNYIENIREAQAQSEKRIMTELQKIWIAIERLKK